MIEVSIFAETALSLLVDKFLSKEGIYCDRRTHFNY